LLDKFVLKKEGNIYDFRKNTLAKIGKDKMIYNCELCKMEVVGEKEWEIHLNGKKHYRSLRLKDKDIRMKQYEHLVKGNDKQKICIEQQKND